MYKVYLKVLLLSVVLLFLVIPSASYANEVKDRVYISGETYDEFGNSFKLIEKDNEMYDDSYETTPYANPMQTMYEQRNKRYIGTFTTITEYLTQDWAYSKEYTFTTSKTFSSSWSISGTVEVKKAISLTGGYTRSVKKGYTVSTVIPANNKKLSKLVRETKYNQYKSDVYKYRTNGIHSTPKEYIGTAHIDSPDSTYLVVKYSN